MSLPRPRFCSKCNSAKVVLGTGKSRCVACRNAHLREYYRASPVRRAKMRDNYLKRRYGVDLQQLELLLERQDGSCAICGRDWVSCRRAKVARFDKDSCLQHLC